MFSDEDVRRLVEDDVLLGNVAEKLLSLYVYPLDNWADHALKLRNTLQSKTGNEKWANETTKRSIAFTILLPVIEPGFKLNPDSPQRLLFGCSKFSNFKEGDWFGELKKVVAQDHLISKRREEIIKIGYIDPIDYHPHSRQAYRWLLEESEKEGSLTPEVRTKFRRLVMAYGGMLLNYVFAKYPKKIEDIPNWRTGYFVERLVHDVFEYDQIVKMKQLELDKSNPKWVKRFNVNKTAESN